MDTLNELNRVIQAMWQRIEAGYPLPNGYKPFVDQYLAPERSSAAKYLPPEMFAKPAPMEYQAPKRDTLFTDTEVPDRGPSREDANKGENTTVWREIQGMPNVYKGDADLSKPGANFQPPSSLVPISSPNFPSPVRPQAADPDWFNALIGRMKI